MKSGKKLNKFNLLRHPKRTKDWASAPKLDRKRLGCPECGGVVFFVDYGKLTDPKKGKRKVGIIGTCVTCGASDRFHSGGSQ